MEIIGKHFLSWEEAWQTGSEQVGGKGWNLARLVRFGFNVPVGGVLTTAAYWDFLNYNQLTEMVDTTAQTVTSANLGESDGLLNALRERIKFGSLPAEVVEEIIHRIDRLGMADKALAVRSSASAEDSARASFAGVHDSYLNVIGRENILQAVKDCYASLWTPRAVAYRRKLNISDQEVLPAVVIMEMVDAVSTGVAFTCDPKTGRRDRMVIQANFGLGETVVSGAVDPDLYYMDASAYDVVPHVMEKGIGSKAGMTRACLGGGTVFEPSGEMAGQQVLADQDMERLGLLLLRVFEALGEGEQHQDVEWAFDGREFIVLQARPVTAMPSYTFEPIKNKTQIWSNGNFREALPMVLSPLQRRFLKNIIDTIQYHIFADAGYPMPDGFQFSRFFQGRLYCNMSALQWAHYDSTGMMPGDFIPFWGGHQPALEIEDPNPFLGEMGLERQRRGMRGFAVIMDAAAQVSDTFAQVQASIRNLMGKGVEDLTDREFLDKYNQLGRVISGYCEKYPFLSSVNAIALVGLMQRLTGFFGPRTQMVFSSLMVGGETASTSADHGYRLIELAQLAGQDEAACRYLNSDSFDPLAWEAQLPEKSRFKQGFRSFIQEYGHRAVYELDIVNPRWKEDPSYLLDIIRSTMAKTDFDQWRAGQKETFERAWQEVVEKIPSDLLEAVQQGIKDVHNGDEIREMTKSVLTMALEPYRLMALELGRRLRHRGIINQVEDIFFCTWPELFSILNREWVGQGLSNLVESRKASQREKEDLAAPDVIIGEKPVYSQPIIQPSGDYLLGVGAAAGRSSGSARRINHPGQGNRLQMGEVLVAPSTDPSWTPLFLKACAVVMETGGFGSHGAIVAREFGIPAVVNVPGVMKAIHDGQTVLVDGDEGKLYLQ
ncbi:MAG TPA: PEP/pyruvate-binding domain-containing protein [Syntrophomonadaceae bacterium]|nr:PEP/pyruvate-binding domain-containing protein [Syntrophomonadaceae bacterium]